MNTSTNLEASFDNSRMQAELLRDVSKHNQQQIIVDNVYGNNSEVVRKISLHKLRNAIFAGAVVTSAVLVPASVFNKDIPLTAEIAKSDVYTAVSELWQMHPGSNEINSERFLARFRLNNGLFKNSDLGWYTSIWPSSVALQALYTTSLLKKNNNYYVDFEKSLKALSQNYWSNSIANQSGYDQGLKVFHSHSDPPLVDDNLWMGLINMGVYNKTHNINDLIRAKKIFDLATSQWDKKNGGVYWMVQLESADNHIRAAVSNASLISLGVELYLDTHKVHYLKESEKIFDWINSVLLDPSIGLYNDHITSSGYVDPVRYTYVQGIMIGAMVSLNRVNPIQYPLSNAIQLANNAMSYFQEHQIYGNPAFDAIWSQNLLRLASYYNNSSFIKRAKQSVSLALKASPKSPRGLLDASGDVVLQDLNKLPVSEYKKILP